MGYFYYAVYAVSKEVAFSVSLVKYRTLYYCAWLLHGCAMEGKGARNLPPRRPHLPSSLVVAHRKTWKNSSPRALRNTGMVLVHGAPNR